MDLRTFVQTHFPLGRAKPDPAKWCGYLVDCPVCNTPHGRNVWTLTPEHDVLTYASTDCATCSEEKRPYDELPAALGMTEDGLNAALREVRAEGTALAAAPEAPAADKKGHTANDVVEWVLYNYQIGRSDDGLLFAVPTRPGTLRIAKEIRAIRADVLKAFREDRKAATGTGVVLGRETLSNALDTVAAYAEEADPVHVAMRSAQVGDDRVVLDLGDATGRVVEITRAGWSVRDPDEGTPLFRRSEATKPLPVPVRGGDLAVLRDLLGLDAEDRRWLQIRGWLVGSLFSEVPRPLLWATGPQGSGKSTRARMVLSLVEPAEALGKEPGRNERDDSTAARGRYLVSFDNVTSVSQNTSDWICRLVTGVTDDRRTLYTDDGLRPVTYRRSGVSTSIALPPGLKPDALERISLVDFDRVPDTERRSEAELWTAYHASKPALLGAVLDDVVTSLRNRSRLVAEGRSWPRMADYAQVVAGVDERLYAAYVGAVDEVLADSALDDPFTAAVLALVAKRGGRTKAKPADFVSPLAASYTGGDTHVSWCPSDGRAFSRALKVAAEALRRAGVTYTTGKSNGDRYIELIGPADPAHAEAVETYLPETHPAPGPRVF